MFRLPQISWAFYDLCYIFSHFDSNQAFQYLNDFILCFGARLVMPNPSELKNEWLCQPHFAAMIGFINDGVGDLCTGTDSRLFIVNESTCNMSWRPLFLVGLFAATATAWDGYPAQSDSPLPVAPDVLPVDDPVKPLDCFQVTHPIMSSEGLAIDGHVIEKQRTMESRWTVLVNHTFGNSFKKPYHRESCS
jgi:hypothetical protein